MQENKNGYKKGLITGCLCTAAILILVFAVFLTSTGRIDWKSGKMTAGDVVKSESNNDVMKKASKLTRYINEYSLNEAEDEKLVSGIYKGMVESLGDVYSAYYTKEEYTKMMEETTGEYCGIGVLMQADTKTGVISIVRVFEGSPAEKAGLKAGDVFYKVTDKDVTGIDSDKLVAMIRGEEGTKVKIEVYRASEKRYVTTEVERKKVEVPTVTSKMLSNQVGYIQITEFEEVTVDQYKKAIEDLKKQGAKGIVFDLRDNPGGLLSSVTEMLDYILPKGLLVYTEDKKGKREEYNSDEKCLDIPFSVLVNGNSASASEVFSGAVKDYGAGKLVGTKTFGKGIVQRIFPLEDGSAIKLTTAKYYTPKGINIHGTGIEPDVKVEAKDGDVAGEKGKDTQLEKAVEALNIK